MLRPVTTRTTGPSTSSSWGSAASAAAAAPSTRRPAVEAHRPRRRARARSRSRSGSRPRRARAPRAGSRRAPPSRRRRSALRSDSRDLAGLPALRHDGRLLRRDSDALGAAAPVAELDPDAAEERAVPDRDDHRGGRSVELVERSRARSRRSRRTARAPLRPRRTGGPLAARSARLVLRGIEVGPDEPELARRAPRCARAWPARAPSGRVHDRPQARAARRPRPSPRRGCPSRP